MPDLKSHTIIIKVKPEHIDDMDHVNNVVYLQWVQDVARSHWEAAAKNDHRENIVWVVLRHEIDYKKPGVLGDDVVVKTWVEEFSGVRSIRRTTLMRQSDSLILAEAKTTWCALDAKTLKPTRIEGILLGRF